MKVVIFGASGMVGQGVLRESLLATDVTEVIAVGRSPLGKSHPKLREIVHKDMLDLTPIADDLTGFDACFYCLGVSSAGMSEVEYTRITHDFTLAAGRVLAERNPGMTFIYVSGYGTDSTEQGRTMWARVKGRTENELMSLPLAAFMFRPGFIRPMHGVKSKTTLYRLLYAVISPLSGLIQRIAPNQVSTTEGIGKAMLEVARSGGPQPILGTRAINALADGPGPARP
ncbi:epimerase [Actinokineospora sp. HUAS TT18]|uniref:epimerase n=1 Tax=Actinokineospora sp. HUAS TT18 TaxID=3447451 RepID=UPI003F523725